MLRNNKNYETIDTKKDGIKFQSKKMQHYNQDYVKYAQEYEESQKSVVDEVMRVASNVVLITFLK